jgi:hypothetical protein
MTHEIDPTDYGEMRADVKNLCGLVQKLSDNLEKHLDRCDSRHVAGNHDLDTRIDGIHSRIRENEKTIAEHATAIKVNAVKSTGWGAVGGLLSATIGWIIFMITGGK